MDFTASVLDEKAKLTVESLINRLKPQVIDSISASYNESCRSLPRLGLQPRDLREDDVKRLSFEILCFAVFILMGQEAPKHITRNERPEQEGIKYFNSKVLESLESYFNSQGYNRICEVVLTAITPDLQCGPGEPLNAAKRISQYLRNADPRTLVELYSQFIAY